MRPRTTGSTDSGGYVAGIVTGVVLAALFPIAYGFVQWLLQTRLSDIVHWWTTPKTLTYTPIDVFSSFFGFFFIVLILFVILGFMMTLRGGSHA